MSKMTRLLCALTALLLTCNELSAKGGNVGSEAPYNPQHIQSLPPNIRNHVMRMCGTPRALHTFSGSDENLQRAVLHFEHFYCEDRALLLWSFRPLASSLRLHARQLQTLPELLRSGGRVSELAGDEDRLAFWLSAVPQSDRDFPSPCALFLKDGSPATARTSARIL